MLLRFVDALTVGDDAPALLVQVEPDRAVVALRPNAVLVVALDARNPESWAAITERVATALHAESPQVIEGLAPNVAAVVLLRSSAGLDALVSAPQRIAGLERDVHWIAVSPNGVMTVDDRALPGMTSSAVREVDRAVERAIAASTADVGTEARALAERYGEQTLADESRVRGVAIAPARRATLAIVIACSAMYVVQMLLAGHSEQSLLDLGAMSGRWVRQGHPEVLVSYAFLYGGIFHILMNMSALFAVGTAVESLVGARRTIVLFTLSVVGGGLALLIFKPDQLVVGASGGIFGVMTALYGISLRRSDLPALTRSRLRKSIGSTLVLNLFISFLPNVSFLGHAGGALVGFLLGVSGALTTGVAFPWRQPPSPTLAARINRTYDVAALLCVITLVGSVAVALVRGQM